MKLGRVFTARAHTPEVPGGHDYNDCHDHDDCDGDGYDDYQDEDDLQRGHIHLVGRQLDDLCYLFNIV